MKIKITVAEYFEQLLLMEQQYGLEEELYPWIYMILHMVECVKQKKQGENYNPISIRDVHNYKEKTIPMDIEEPRRQVFIKIVEKLGPPEFIILTKKTEKILGCIEMKRRKEFVELINESLNNKKSTKREYKVNILKPIKVELKYSVVIKSESRKKDIVDWKRKIKNELNKNKIGFSNIELRGQNRNTFYFYVEIDNLDEKVIEKITAYNPEIKNIYKFNKFDIWENEALINCEGGNLITRQLVSHLEKYAKVIYTDGLRFYYLELKDKDEKNNIIYVEKIADLQHMYDEFCQDKENWKPQKGNQWDKLLLKLRKIDWHSEPIVKISTDNKED